MAASLVRVPRPDGAEIAVQVGGPVAGPTMFLLQGQASSHDWWAGLRHRYQDRFRTVTMDYRGTGETDAPAGDLSTELLAGDTVAVLDALGVRRAHVYGTSMGGRVAQMLAGRHPGRVQSLVMACTSPGGPQATERSNEVRKALANPDPSARTRALAGLFYTPA
ncbi:MAG TPA: alpha/beta fold hydrolase [Marmoricola sp.]|nr:alpha/beta fold hydrolase [Marmoricola sp.]